MFERNIAVYVLSNPIRYMLWEKGAYTLIGLRVLQQIAVDSTPISTKIIRDQFPRTKFPIGMCIYLCFLLWRHGAKSRISADPGWQGNFYFRAAIAASLDIGKLEVCSP
jgi:hypothetical protein